MSPCDVGFLTPSPGVLLKTSFHTLPIFIPPVSIVNSRCTMSSVFFYSLLTLAHCLWLHSMSPSVCSGCPSFLSASSCSLWSCSPFLNSWTYFDFYKSIFPPSMCTQGLVLWLFLYRSVRFTTPWRCSFICMHSFALSGVQSVTLNSWIKLFSDLWNSEATLFMWFSEVE